MNEKLLQDLNINTKPIRLDREKSASGRRVTEVLFRAISEGGLPSLLRYGDRNAMNFSIENRVPFLHYPWQNFFLVFLKKYLISEDGQTKYLFRNCYARIVPK